MPDDKKIFDVYNAFFATFIQDAFSRDLYLIATGISEFNNSVEKLGFSLQDPSTVDFNNSKFHSILEDFDSGLLEVYMDINYRHRFISSFISLSAGYSDSFREYLNLYLSLTKVIDKSLIFLKFFVKTREASYYMRACQVLFKVINEFDDHVSDRYSDSQRSKFLSELNEITSRSPVFTESELNIHIKDFTNYCARLSTDFRTRMKSDLAEFGIEI